MILLLLLAIRAEREFTEGFIYSRNIYTYTMNVMIVNSLPHTLLYVSHIQFYSHNFCSYQGLNVLICHYIMNELTTCFLVPSPSGKWKDSTSSCYTVMSHCSNIGEPADEPVLSSCVDIFLYALKERCQGMTVRWQQAGDAAGKVKWCSEEKN